MWYCFFKVITSGGDNIGIKFEKLQFNDETFYSLNRFAKSYRFKTTYSYGYLLKFDKVNIYAISPHKIIFTENDKNLLILHYDDYTKKENLYFIYEENAPFTISKTKRYIKEYFSKKT